MQLLSVMQQGSKACVFWETSGAMRASQAMQLPRGLCGESMLPYTHESPSSWLVIVRLLRPRIALPRDAACTPASMR